MKIIRRVISLFFLTDNTPRKPLTPEEKENTQPF